MGLFNVRLFLIAALSTTNPSTWSITIKDFAYQSIPDSSILAGDMGGTTNLNERFATTKIFAANKQVNLSFNEADFSNTQISVYNNLRSACSSTRSNKSKRNH